MEYLLFFTELFLASPCSLGSINFQDPCASLLRYIPPIVILPTIISGFVIDFIKLVEQKRVIRK